MVKNNILFVGLKKGESVVILPVLKRNEDTTLKLNRNSVLDDDDDGARRVGGGGELKGGRKGD